MRKLTLLRYIAACAAICFGALCVWVPLEDQRVHQVISVDITAMKALELPVENTLPSNASSEVKNNHTSSSMSDGQPTRRKVIIMSYMRSGSTFTGDIFQFSLGVFYEYEPLLYVNDVDVLETKKPARQRTIPQFRNEQNVPELLDFTLDMINCRFTTRNLHFLLGLTYSKTMTEFLHCKNSSPNALDECGIKLKDKCIRSSAVVAKILRLKMADADDLLSRDPQLKIIHLIRDPRGISVSRRKVAYGFNRMSFCQRFNIDSENSAALSQKYPGRILTVRYDDLARDPLGIAKIMYEFSGIPWTEPVQSQLINITSPSENRHSESAFSTNRNNPSATAFSWRQQVSFHEADSLQTLCKTAMIRYGYVSFKNDTHMKNLTVPSYTENYDNAYLKGQTLSVRGV